MKRRAVFLDRDGTLMEEVEYCADPARVRLLAGVPEGLAALKAAGFALIIVTNQSGLGRGMFTPAQYEAVQARLLSLLGGGTIEATYFCPDHPDRATPWRKPAPGMVLEAERNLDLELSRSWLIGDRASDALCGLRAGVSPILVRTGYGASETAPAGCLTAPDFLTAAGLILSHSGGLD